MTDCFVFQAEDGIRDLTVTGVQTCALPICRRARSENFVAMRVRHFASHCVAPGKVRRPLSRRSPASSRRRVLSEKQRSRSYLARSLRSWKVQVRRFAALQFDLLFACGLAVDPGFERV